MQKMDLPGVQPLTSLLFLSQPTKRIQGLDRETNPPTPNTSEAAQGGTWSDTDHKHNSGGQTLLLRGQKEEWTEIRSDSPIVFASVFAERSFNCKNGCINPVPKLWFFFFFFYICTGGYASILLLALPQKITWSQITVILVFHCKSTFFSPRTGYW